MILTAGKRILFLIPDGSQFPAYDAKVLEKSRSGKYVKLSASEWGFPKWFLTEQLNPHEILPD